MYIPVFMIDDYVTVTVTTINEGIASTWMACLLTFVPQRFPSLINKQDTVGLAYASLLSVLTNVYRR